MRRWRLVYYRDETGRYPVRQYIAELDEDEQVKVRFDLNTLRDFGLELGAPYVRSIGGKLWELRTAGQVQHRILYFAVEGQRFMLLHAFTKKTPKTPPAEIETARRRMAVYLDRIRAAADQEHNKRRGRHE